MPTTKIDQLPDNQVIGWTDAQYKRDATGRIAMRNGNQPQGMRFYQSETDSSISRAFARLEWVGNTFRIEVGSLGAVPLKRKIVIAADEVEIQNQVVGANIVGGGGGTLNFTLPPLPTEDPHIVGKLWVDTTDQYVIKQSQG